MMGEPSLKAECANAFSDVECSRLLPAALLLTLILSLYFSTPEWVKSQTQPIASQKLAPRALQDLLGKLDQAGLQDIIQKLKSDYLNPNAISNQEINEATVEALLARLGPGATISEDIPVSAPIRPFKTEILQNQFGYVRLGTFSQQDLSLLDKALTEFRTRGVSGLILDLRTMQAGTDYQLAAESVARLVPKGRILFKLVSSRGNSQQAFISSQEPLFTGPLVVTISPQNAGMSEAIAGALKSFENALLIGQTTSGRAVEYQRFPLNDHLVLTIAVSELVIPGIPPIFPAGLKPDIPIAMPIEEEKKILLLGDQQGVADLITDEERPHTNEAALIAGKNPDLDAYEADQAAKKLKSPKLKDLVVQRAVDFLTTVNILHR
ncbi:MAG: hypothetical protein JO076_11525 [Verrucomicrobia bacterium]|nr:hypothetical protein [Verrucomicrobiota bacterium]